MHQWITRNDNEKQSTQHGITNCFYPSWNKSTLYLSLELSKRRRGATEDADFNVLDELEWQESMRNLQTDNHTSFTHHSHPLNNNISTVPKTTGIQSLRWNKPKLLGMMSWTGTRKSHCQSEGPDDKDLLPIFGVCGQIHTKYSTLYWMYQYLTCLNKHILLS